MTKPRMTLVSLWRWLPWTSAVLAMLALVSAVLAWNWAAGAGPSPSEGEQAAAAGLTAAAAADLRSAVTRIEPSAPMPVPAAPAAKAAPAAPRSAPVPVRRSSWTTAASRAVAAGEFAYAEMVRRIARRHSVEWKLVAAIIASESGGDPDAVSPAGAVGLMQLMPDTADRLGVDPYDPEQNVEGAVRYLARLLSTFKSVDLTLIAYNAGPGFAIKYKNGDAELNAETREFLMRVGDLLQGHARRDSAKSPGPAK
jgi:soluble lytic murein transglycosylase-like protein